MYQLRLFIGLMVIVLLVSCQNQRQNNSDFSSDTDSLLTELRKMDDSLKTLDIQKIQHINDSLRAYYDTANIKDTVERKYQVYTHSRNIMDWYDNLNREINYSRTHLTTLEQQFNQNNLPDSTKKKKLKKEKEIVFSLKSRFGEEYRSLRAETKALLDRTQANE